MRVAITREVSPTIERCELTHLLRTPIDAVLARRQHENYERNLALLGCQWSPFPFRRICLTRFSLRTRRSSSRKQP